MNNEIMTIKEVAIFLKVNERTIYRLAINGKMPAFKVGAAWRVSRDELNIWIENQKMMGTSTNE